MRAEHMLGKWCGDTAMGQLPQHVTSLRSGSLGESKIFRSYPRSGDRRGAAGVFVVTLLLALVIMGAVTVNLAYMRMLRTQHKIAVDASSKAAVEALWRTEDPKQARAAAKNIAARFQLGSTPLTLGDSDIIFGRSEKSSSGQFEFVPQATPYNAVQVLGNISNGNPTSPIPMIFTGFGHNDYQGSAPSTSTFLVNEVMICLDRSGSMKWGMSGLDWEYPNGNPYYADDVDLVTKYYSEVHPTLSRWAITRIAIEAFFDEAASSSTPPRVALTTWSSNHNSSGLASLDYPMPPKSIEFSTNADDIRNAIDVRGYTINESGVFGGTYMGDGLSFALDELIDNENSHSLANRAIILLSDGQDYGADPTPIATAAKNAGVKIHCVALLSGDAFDGLQTIASITGGSAYMATDSAELEGAFREIARSMNVVLTQ